MKKILISGITGFLGSRLKEYLLSQNFEVEGIKRSDFINGQEFLSKKISQADIVINLSGAPINKRWTKKYKQTLINSRIESTSKIVEAIRHNTQKPALLISASAVGIYSENGIHTETSEIKNTDFLKEICIQWETQALKAEGITSVCICRLGVVLDKEGGAFSKMVLPFKLGVGGKIGNGKQMLSWIHIDDLLQSFFFIIKNNYSGIFNICAPEALSNEEISNSIAKKLDTHSYFKIPVFALNLVFGAGSTVLTNGQHAYPQNLLQKGFHFKYPDFNSALKDLL